MVSQRDKRVKDLALLCARHKVSDVANLVEVFRTNIFAIKKRMDDGEGVNRRAGTGVERLLWIVAACGMSFEVVP